MGLLDNLTRNPGLLALAALGIGLFIFRDRISGFFSDITGGAKGAASIAETGGILSRNFTSFLTATPLAEDPIFGEQGFFANISKGISDFKLPSFELPSFELPSFPSVSVEGNFIDTGMAGARARQTERQPLDRELGIGVPGFDVKGFATLAPQVLQEDIFNITDETQAQFQERAGAFVTALPDVTSFTSLPGASTDLVRRQLSRSQEDFQSILESEARRSETIFAGLFGNVQNPNF